MPLNPSNLEEKQSVIWEELFALHVHFICVGLHTQRKVKKMHSVIKVIKGGSVKLLFQKHQSGGELIKEIIKIHQELRKI